MEDTKWKDVSFLSIGEDVLYRCEIEDEEEEKKYTLYITNYRVILATENILHSFFFKFISLYGIYTGYDDFSHDGYLDVGTGEYGLFFDYNDYEVTLWFYSEDVWKTVYHEILRAILET